MDYIDVSALSYEYKIFKKQSTLKGSFADFFHRKYQQKKVLNDINFTIHKGEKVGILGPNGSGKTTLIKLLTGILVPKSGSITIDKMVPNTNNNTFLNKIGVVLGQKSQLNWNLPAVDTFKMLQSIYKIPDTTFEKRLAKYLNIFNVQAVSTVPVRKLSLGERTKLELIAALIHEPELLILDEPTLGLDIVSQKELHRLINQINKDEQITILIISHQLSDIQAISNRLLILLNKSIVFDGPLNQIHTALNPTVPKMILYGKDKNPVITVTNAEVSNSATNATISSYQNNSTATINLSEIQSIALEETSLEENLYQLFLKQEGD